MTDYFLDVSYLSHFHAVLLDSDYHAATLAEKEIAKINSPLPETNLYIVALPEYDFGQLNKVLDHFTIKDFRSITILVNNDTQQLSPQLSLLSVGVLDKCKIIHLNFLPWWYQIKMQEQNHTLPTSWNWTKTKSILRTGSLDRSNRVGLLKHLYDHNLLDDILWTFPFADKQKLKVLNYFAEHQGGIPENFADFYTYCSTHATKQKNERMVYDVFPQLKEILSDCSYADAAPEYHELGNFSIITETLGGHISERSYLAILHRHPFMIISESPQAVQKLKDFGFKTFENYFPHSNYANIKNSQIVENIAAIQTILKAHKEEITVDIEHNYDLCLRIIAETQEQLNDISPVLTTDRLSNLNFLNLSGVDLDFFVEFKKQEKILVQEKENKEFLEEYEVYRGADWPDIKDKNDFLKLPDWIKKECEVKFKSFGKLLCRDIIDRYLSETN